MPRKKILTPEEIKKAEEKAIEDRMQFELDQLREGFYPEPNYQYKIGDRVRHGGVEVSHVTEICDGGKFLRLHEKCVDNIRGARVESERDMYVDWISIQPWKSIEENKKIPLLSDKDDVFTKISYLNNDISGVLLRYYHFGVDMEPDYQRGSVWNDEDREKLIDSIFKGLDIGKFVFIHLPFKHKSPSYEILDGKQRLMTLLLFNEGKLRYKGKLHREMNLYDQHVFKNHHVSVANVDSERVARSQKYKYFLRLNVFGKPQDPKHIEKVQRLYEEALILEGKQNENGKTNNGQ